MDGGEYFILGGRFFIVGHKKTKRLNGPSSGGGGVERIKTPVPCNEVQC